METPEQRLSHVRCGFLPRYQVGARRQRLAATLAVAVVTWGWAGVTTAATTVTLPIEIVGENGTTSSVAVDVPARHAGEVRSLWLQIHGLSYPDMVSVQINHSAWFALNNDTVVVAEPGKSYGGIGGGFSTLKMTLALPVDTVVQGANTIRFRFNKSDGVVSGFRVVAFNLLTGDSSKVLEPDTFTQEDPNTWTAPLRDPDSILAGQQLWLGAQLRASNFPNAPQIRARCSDCHARDGRDLKYFGFSNASIVARSRFHGLSDLQAQQIASYIRSLPVPSPGRPWNPPYQPGPGLDAQPIANWAAGAGLSWVLDHDSATFPFIFAAGGDLAGRSADDASANGPEWSAIVPAISRNAFRPDGNLNPREIPISLQLPDWSHWLPRVHPLDAWGPAFQNSEFSQLYGGSKQSLRDVLASPDLSALISSGRIVTSFDKWTNARRAFLKSYLERKGVNWSPDLALRAYSTQLWQLVKTWEVTQEFGLEARGRELFGTSGDSRTWFNTIPAATAPVAVNIPDGPSGMGGSALTNEYFDTCWYELQVLVNSGNHRHRDRLPMDWIYVIGGFQDLYGESRRPEPARLLVALIKAMQSTDPRIGPEDVSQGWRPSQNVDPTIMVNAAWAPMFQPLPVDVKRAITESLLAAWLDKNQQYPVGRYFRVGLTESSYAAPASYGNVSGGKVWEAAPLFTAAGVNPEIVRQLQKWGTSYADTAARFQYSPGGTARSKGTAPKKRGGG
jgi:cytochrome c553